jgi:hypothetical protein
MTSGMRTNWLSEPCPLAQNIFAEYEAYKETYQNTGQQCREQGFEFQPLVVETHGGGWSFVLRRLVGDVAKRQREVSLDGQGEASLRIAQRLSVSIHAENARAILQRTPCPEGECPSAEGADWDFVPDTPEACEDEVMD